MDQCVSGTRRQMRSVEGHYEGHDKIRVNRCLRETMREEHPMATLDTSMDTETWSSLDASIGGLCLVRKKG